MFSLPVILGVNSRSPCGSEEREVTVVTTLTWSKPSYTHKHTLQHTDEVVSKSYDAMETLSTMVNRYGSAISHASIMNLWLTPESVMLPLHPFSDNGQKLPDTLVCFHYIHGILHHPASIQHACVLTMSTIVICNVQSEFWSQPLQCRFCQVECVL